MQSESSLLSWITRNHGTRHFALWLLDSYFWWWRERVVLTLQLRNRGNWWDNSRLLHGRYSVRTATMLPTTVSACQDSKMQRSTNFPKIEKMPQISKRTKWWHQARSLPKTSKIRHHHLKFSLPGDMVRGIWAPLVEWPQQGARDWTTSSALVDNPPWLCRA
jgi:hypothetical protein